MSLEKFRWYTWTQHSRMAMELRRRYDVQKIPAGIKPDELLIKGELDAVILTSLFPSFARGAPNVRRLFENYQEVETAYFKKTGISPSCTR